MAVYKGVLNNISGGKVVSSEGTGGYYTHNMNHTKYRRTGVDWQAGFTKREFVDIGETRIRSVMLTPYYDELLQEAIGEEVELSITGPKPSSSKRHTIVAMRTPKGGLNRPSRTQLSMASIGLVLRYSLTALVIGGILAFIGWAIAGDRGLVVAVAFVIIFAISVFRQLRRTFRAAAAL